jgi:hypothetical protein
LEWKKLIVISLASYLAFFLIATQPSEVQAADTFYGCVHGRVYGWNSDRTAIQPLVWANVTATNGTFTASTSTDDGGYYRLFLPAPADGVAYYNITASAPGYFSQTVPNVAVSKNMDVSLNFVEDLTLVAIPEFPTYLTPLIVFLGIIVVCYISRWGKLAEQRSTLL